MLFLRILGGALAVLLPAVLLLDPHANFYYDWHNHQWLTGYFGEYFRQHGRMPEAISVAGAVGMPQPVFYGFLLYPCLGALSALLGASLAIRCAVVGALAAQFLAVWLAGRRTLRHEGLAWMTAAAVTWSSHELTNHYNRAALTEFFAAVFLTTAVAFGIAAVAEDGAARRRCLAVLAFFFATLMVGSHPPTALVAAGFLGALLMVAALSRWRERSAAEVRVIAVCAMLGVVVVSPWVYANLRLQDQLGVTARYRELSLSAERWDSPWLRFSPVPFDPQPPAVKHDPAAGTPFVEAPLRFALLLLGAWNAWLLWRVARAPSSAWTGVRPASEGISPSAARWLAALGLAWFALTVSISISRTMVDAFRFLAPYVQFATRFVSHANAGLLVFVLASGAMVARRGGYGRFR